MKSEIVIGMAGAGRATELHINALKRFTGIPLRFKTIVARRKEQLELAQKRYGFEKISTDFSDLLNDKEIDVIDICTPPYLHSEMLVKAVNAGKDVICEKPLTGYFGREGDIAPIGNNVSKQAMYEHLLAELDKLQSIIKKSGKKFMYAENFVYASSVVKASEIIRKKQSRILYAKGEESLKGSSSAVAGEWAKTGGGTFLRTGSHPLSAILYLKEQEAIAHNAKIEVKSVIADMGRITPKLSEYEHRHIKARPLDVEDCGTAILKFSDESRANIVATDTLLGGSKNVLELYCNDAVINCNITMSNLMEIYFPDEERLDGVYISEMLDYKTGWHKPFLEDEIIRGYTDEMRDFMDAILFDKEPKSGFELAKNTIKIIYAAYLSAELGKEVLL